MKSHIAAKHRHEEYKPPLKIDENVIEEYIQQKLDKEGHVYELREQKKGKNEIKRKRRNFKLYTCDLCGEQEETKKLIEFHISTHIITIYNCGQCDESFETKSAYKNHRVQHSVEIVTYHCDFCGKNFNSKENIRTHQKNIHGYGLKCESCKIPIESKEELISHMREEHGDIPCKFCGKMFLIPSKLKAHEIRHMVQAESKPK
jgi:transcription elongation factor Elf1